MSPPRPMPSLAAQKHYWDERWTAKSQPNDWQLRRGERVRQWLLRLALRQPKILDFGCGTGWFANRLAEVGDVTAIDLSEAAIAIARRRYPRVNFIAGDLFEAPLATEYFDVVVSQEVIAHVEQQEEYLDRCASVLRPSGHLIITTANRFVMDRLGWPQPPGHIEQYLYMRDFKRMIRRRFSVLDATSIIPIGDTGLLRITNSTRLNALAARLFSVGAVERFKERARLGYTLIALAKRAW